MPLMFHLNIFQSLVQKILPTSPVGFQQYSYYYYKKPIIKYYCWKNILQTRISKDRMLTMTMYRLIRTILSSESGVCLNLLNIKLTAKNTMHGSMTKNKNCTLMLLSNLAEPDWIHISCKSKLLFYTVCVKQPHLSDIYLQNVKSKRMCKYSALLINRNCVGNFPK